MSNDLARRIEAANALVSQSALPPLPPEYELRINTHADVQVTNTKKNGVEIGSFKNKWLDCPFVILSGPGGFRWKVTFRTLDDKQESTAIGTAQTRNQAVHDLTHRITLRIADEVALRLAWQRRWAHAQRLSLRDGVALATPPPPVVEPVSDEVQAALDALAELEAKG